MLPVAGTGSQGRKGHRHHSAAARQTRGLIHQCPTAQPLLDMVTATDASVAALPDLASYISALDPVVAAWGALPADKASVLDTATQAITDLNGQATQAWSRPYSRPYITVKNAKTLDRGCMPCVLLHTLYHDSTCSAPSTRHGCCKAGVRVCVHGSVTLHCRKSSPTHGAG